MSWLKESKEIVEDMIEEELLTEEPNLLPDISRLPVKIWIDDKQSFKNGKHWNRIKFYDHAKNEFSMDLDGNFKPQSSENKCKLKSKEIGQLRNFIDNNKYALEKLGQKGFIFKDIQPFLIMGGNRATNLQISNLKKKVDELLTKNGVVVESFNSNIKLNRKKYNLKTKSEDLIYFYTIDKEASGLPVVIYVDEDNTYAHDGLDYRIKFRGDHENFQGDNRAIFEMDLNGNIYSIGFDSYFSLNDKECEQIKNWFNNNLCALENIYNEKVGTSYILPYLVKGGEIATEEQKEELKSMCEYMSWVNNNWKKESRKRKKV